MLDILLTFKRYNSAAMWTLALERHWQNLYHLIILIAYRFWYTCKSCPCSQNAKLANCCQTSQMRIWQVDQLVKCTFGKSDCRWLTLHLGSSTTLYTYLNRVKETIFQVARCRSQRPLSSFNIHKPLSKIGTKVWNSKETKQFVVADSVYLAIFLEPVLSVCHECWGGRRQM